MSTNGTSAARWDRPGAVSAASVVAFSGCTVGGIPGNSVAFLKFGSKTNNRHFDQEVRGAPVLRGSDLMKTTKAFLLHSRFPRAQLPPSLSTPEQVSSKHTH